MAPAQVVPEAAPHAHGHERVSPIRAFRVCGDIQPVGHVTWPGSERHVLPKVPPLSGTHVPGWFWHVPAPASGTVHTVISTGALGGSWGEGVQVPCRMTCEGRLTPPMWGAAVL